MIGSPPTDPCQILATQTSNAGVTALGAGGYYCNDWGKMPYHGYNTHIDINMFNDLKGI